MTKSFSFSSLAWNTWCIASVVGIWPQFIEPRLIATSKLTIPIENLPKDLEGLKILQFSDLHFSERTSARFLKKLTGKIRALKPDLVVFTGDFLCYSQIAHPEKLRELFNSIEAPYGCFAIFGNHDYNSYVSVNSEGNYDVIELCSTSLKKGLKKVLQPTPALTKHVTDCAKKVPLNQPLITLLEGTPFQILHNETKKIAIKNSFLNVCGLGEYSLGKCKPEQTSQEYDLEYPGVLLVHNPDAISLLHQHPGDLILCGHTHGGQVNLPFLCKKFMLTENPHLKRGLIKIGQRWLYINRGLGSALSFRWFSMPEITLFTLRSPS